MRTGRRTVCETGAVKSVRTALRVFETVAAHQPIGLSELSRRLDVPKASVQRALATLAEAGWLRHDISEPGRWVVTAHFAVLADAAPAVVAAREAARHHLADLADEVRSPVGLFVLDGDRMAVVSGLAGAEAVRAVESSFGPLPVHVSAAGRAILSRLPEPTRREILARALPRFTEASLTEPDAVLAEVARAERDGYAVTLGEYHPDLDAVAAPVLDRRGLPVAALAALVSRSDPASPPVPAVGRAVVAAAGAVTGDLAAAADGLAPGRR